MYAFIMMLLVDYFNDGYLPIIMYKLLVDDDIWNWFDWLFPVFSSCPHFSLVSLMMTTLDITSSLAITDFYSS